MNEAGKASDSAADKAKIQNQRTEIRKLNQKGMFCNSWNLQSEPSFLLIHINHIFKHLKERMQHAEIEQLNKDLDQMKKDNDAMSEKAQKRDLGKFFHM